MSLVIATLVSTVIAAGIPANVVVRQNPNIPNLPNMPSELAGLLDGVNIPADMAGLLGATNVAGLAGLLNAEDMQHVSEALQWAGDSERMFNDPDTSRFRALCCPRILHHERTGDAKRQSGHWVHRGRVSLQ